MVFPLCRVCGSSRHRMVLNDYQALGRSWDLIQCLGCGLISTHPMPEDDVLARHYADGYWAASDDRSAGVMYNLRMCGFSGRLRRMVRSGDRALDVGAGNGAWVRLLQSRGFEAIGIDPYTTDTSGGHVLGYALEESLFEKSSFDLITFMHVLEHTKDPLGTLKIANRLLKPDGLLVIEVPNINSLGFAVFKKRWFPMDDIPSHINHFSRQSLLNTVQACGEYDLILDEGFSLKDSPSILTNTLLPGLSPRQVRRRYAGRHPLHLKVVYLLAQVSFLPAACISACAGRGEVVRLVLKKKDRTDEL